MYENRACTNLHTNIFSEGAPAYEQKESRSDGKFRRDDFANGRVLNVTRATNLLPQIGEKAATVENRAVLERFYEVWTAKEAYFKKMGTGITDLKSVDVTSLEKKVIIEDDYLITII